MQAKELGVLLLFLSTLLTCSAYIFKDRAELIRRCKVMYHPLKSCQTLVLNLNEKSCENFNCCWIPDKPDDEMNCYTPYDDLSPSEKASSTLSEYPPGL